MFTKGKRIMGKTSAIKNKSIAILLAPVALAIFLSGCDKKEEAAPQQQQQAPKIVGYVTVMPSDVGLTMELPGRLEAFRVADVRARVAGVVQKKMFEEGTLVEEGQQLFQIDDAPYRATLQSAKAQLAQAQASLAQTKAMADRYKPLVKVNAISKQDYDNAVAAQRASEANVMAARAAVTNAQINLDYAAVKSPISGRIGRALVTEGALVGQGSVTELAVVQQIDKLYVNITQSATDYIKLQEALKTPGRFKRAGDGSLPITITLDDGTAYPKQAGMMFTDWTVNEATGQVTMRAVLDNQDQILLPGLYVRVKLDQIQAENAFLVPQRAVMRTGKDDILFVVVEKENVPPTENAQALTPDEDKKKMPKNWLEMRKVNITGRSNNNWVVSEGLQAGDRIVVDGIQAQMAMGGALQAYGAKMQEYHMGKASGQDVGEPPAPPSVPVDGVIDTEAVAPLQKGVPVPSESKSPKDSTEQPQSPVAQQQSSNLEE